ncbi:hypothetical protein CHS0354_032829 [Potamilus streckersoni]|uniref:Sulfotransferase domain-containing protein n=1 Tax=Potamilus streckersoni TaxID=2493646 RepID=A0AAE0S958_9BIVA|nr:hypothetical protein CHS0354_032829 [Potamilus streckersoni]
MNFNNSTNTLEKRTFLGPKGGEITVNDVDGYYFMEIIPDPQQRIRDIALLKALSDDVLICSYPKSGLHWVWEIVTMLRSEDVVPSSHLMEGSLIDFVPALQIGAQKSPRTLTTHIPAQMLPDNVKKYGCKLILILRDPRAVAVAYYKHYQKIKMGQFSGTWEDFLHLFLRGQVAHNSWFDHAKSWEKFIKTGHSNTVHIVYYEDLKRDPVNEIAKMGTFLGLSKDMDYYASVAKATNIQNLKSSKEKLGEKKIGAFFERQSYPFFRKGENDDWMNFFTVSQNYLFEDIFKKEMKESSVKLRSFL